MRLSPILILGWVMPALAILASACEPLRPPAPHSSSTPSLVPPIANTPSPTPTALRTPPVLPGTFQSSRLNPMDTPRAYIGDECQYLRDKWDSEKAAPGTIVMIVMLHSINKGRAEGADAISDSDCGRMMDDLHRQQFQAIGMQRLVDFLEHNTKIPPRSVLLLQDGRHYAENFNENFRRYWDQWGWPVVNAWDIQGNTSEALWAEQIALESEGWVDHQVYGVTFNPAAGSVADEYLTKRMQTPIALFQERFHKKPLAIVWPNGFSGRAAEIARELGYRVGFTFNPRGPVMFNWVPLADSADGHRPSYFPEGSVNDPLMTLPRYWPNQVRTALDSVRLMGREAASYADRNRVTELEYYDIVCTAKYGPVP